MNSFSGSVNTKDYYSFGMMMPGRSFSAGNYRFGFNGKENDDEVKGKGDQQNYGMRIYDPRLGRFLSVDPITKNYPELTPYQFSSNTPIQAIDLDGKEAQIVTGVGSFLLDVGVQYAVNVSFGAGPLEALNQVDLFDATITGLVGAGTLGLGTTTSIERSTSKAILRNLAKITVMASATQAAVDYTIGKGAESIGNGKTASDFCQDLCTGIVTDELGGKLLNTVKEESKATLGNIKHQNTLPSEQRDVYKKVDKIVNSKGTEKGVNAVGDFIGEGLKKQLGQQSQKNNSNKTSEGASKPSLDFKIEPAAADNTRVVQ